VAAYRDSFFNPKEYANHGVALASVRAGNVIGGGDWEESRLVPDIIRAFVGGRPVRLRSPHAIRPWQHVLEPLRGYLTLAESMWEHGTASGEAWNFGPDQSDAQPVEWVVQVMAGLWGDGARWEREDGAFPHEANHLTLDSSKACVRLGWRPELRLNDALAMTVSWYQARVRGQEMGALTRA
jgi:CDP-glucose 4,6-dehydratase